MRSPQHLASSTVLALAVGLASGCCQPYGWVLKGDCALELNRVAWIGSRGDCYEGCGGCGGGHEGGGDYQMTGGAGVAPLDPAFHPVPMRSPYGYPPYSSGPTRAPETEDLPAPPDDTIRAPAASVPRRLSEGAQRASWSYGRKPIKPLPNFGPPRKQPAMHVWRPTR